MTRIFSLFLILLFSGCEKYTQPSLLSLSGTYVIDAITIETDNSLMVNLLPGDTFVNNNGIAPSDTTWSPLGPTDTIFVGYTRWAFDYLKLYMRPEIQEPRIIWHSIFYYQTYLQTSYDYGFIQFYYESNNIRLFKIVNDATESVTLRTYGEWVDGYYKTMTLTLTRIGP